AAGETAVVVVVGDDLPTLMNLAADVVLAGVALGVERIEFLLEAVFGRFAGVDRAMDRALGGRSRAGFGASHRWSSFCRRKKRKPFVCVPVIFFATALRDRKTSPSYSNPLASTRTWSFCPL